MRPPRPSCFDGAVAPKARVGGQPACHLLDGLRHHRDRDQLQSVDGHRGRRVVGPETDRSPGRQDHQDGRGQREPGPGGERPQRSGSPGTKRKANLRGRRARQELAERHHVGVCGVIDPAPPLDELGAEIAYVGHRAAERRQAEPEERQEHFSDAAAARPVDSNPALFPHFTLRFARDWSVGRRCPLETALPRRGVVLSSFLTSRPLPHRATPWRNSSASRAPPRVSIAEISAADGTAPGRVTARHA